MEDLTCPNFNYPNLNCLRAKLSHTLRDHEDNLEALNWLFKDTSVLENVVYIFKGADGEPEEEEDFTKVRDKVEDFEIMPEPVMRTNCFFFDYDNLEADEEMAEEFLEMIWDNCSEEPIPCLAGMFDVSEDEDENDEEE